jgi:SAM-dependent methyltransferase
MAHTVKDNFSVRSGSYARFRPNYPSALFDWLFSLVRQHENAWDCGTGNGQVAAVLAEKFRNVYGTDISESQLREAIQKKNIQYKVESAESTSFDGAFFDLITVAQAIHWFDFDAFYREVKRVLRPNGIFAVIGYNLPSIGREADPVLKKFYHETTAPYWDAERKYIDENYQTIPFPFNEIKPPEFSMDFQWDANHFISFVSTWSAVNHMIKAGQPDPIPSFRKQLLAVWPADEIRTVSFPLLLRAGKLKQ